MCLTSGREAGTAETIFSKVEQAMTSNHVPWENCFGMGMDNARVNMGRNNSTKTCVLQKNSATYIEGCLAI